ncbi:MAG: DUF262 domain-containing protein [Streptosporangiales bacterium]|nr:DUF262 domain-containing protein [Streptosporangiales bacterium]
MNALNRIGGEPRTVRALLHGRKYYLDLYQREYAWERKQIAELLDDLETKFTSNYQDGHERTAVESYQQYFLGSIIISQKGTDRYIVDGQQRLTSLTLLLIYLHHLSDAPGVADLRDLIFSERYGKRSFNLEGRKNGADSPEDSRRVAVMEALFSGKEYVGAAGDGPTVRNLLARYTDIEELFPDTLTSEALPYFVDWLLENVSLIEIVAYNSDDAYTIFETMNDRGLSLTPTEMLKGYLLANIESATEQRSADAQWKQRVQRLTEQAGKETDADFIKAWLRGQHALTMRERKKDALPRDWDIIGTAFHKWVRDHRDDLGLTDSKAFRDFIQEDVRRYSRHYLTALDAAGTAKKGWTSVFYNAHNDFTLQYPLMLAPLTVSDTDEVADRKMRLVADFLDIFIARRIVNYKQIGYSAMSYTAFNLMRRIRRLPLDELADTLIERLEQQEETFDGVSTYALNQMNGPRVRYILARFTAHIEAECGIESEFHSYVASDIKKPFEVEHIWGNDYSQLKDTFASAQEFASYRNRLGGLILLPRGLNQSLGAAPYAQKIGFYFGENLLAKSLSPDCYTSNPNFLRYVAESGLPFKPYTATLTKLGLDERQELYRQLAMRIWTPSRLRTDL